MLVHIIANYGTGDLAFAEEQEATVSDGTLAVRHDELAFASGSSGWPLPSGKGRWIEIVLRGGNAWDLFENNRQSVPP